MTTVDNPFVSIVVPVYNDAEGLRTTVESLLEQEYSSFEVLVVDNNSTDETHSVACSYATANDTVHVEVEDGIQSSYAARNRGIRESNGEILAFVDSDMFVKPTWLDAAVETLQKKGASYLACDVEVVPASERLVERYDTATGFPIRTYVREQAFAPTCCLLVRRSVFEEVGTFDARLISGGDNEFGRRVAAAGIEQHVATNATMYHPARSSFRSQISKEIRVGRGFCQLQRCYPERYGKPGRPPRPSGAKSGTQKTESDSMPVAFRLLNKMFLFFRGVGYLREVIRGDDITKQGPAPTEGASSAGLSDQS